MRLPQAYSKHSRADQASINVGALWEKVKARADLARKLEADKATKEEVSAAVLVLQLLKAAYKGISGRDYDPNSEPTTPPPPTGGVSAAAGLRVKLNIRCEMVWKTEDEVSEVFRVLQAFGDECEQIPARDYADNPNQTPTAVTSAPAEARADGSTMIVA